MVVFLGLGVSFCFFCLFLWVCFFFISIILNYIYKINFLSGISKKMEIRFQNTFSNFCHSKRQMAVSVLGSFFK